MRPFVASRIFIATSSPGRRRRVRYFHTIVGWMTSQSAATRAISSGSRELTRASSAAEPSVAATNCTCAVTGFRVIRMTTEARQSANISQAVQESPWDNCGLSGIAAWQSLAVAKRPLADLVWLAWHSLPREKRGKPPAKAKVEKSVEPPIANGTLNKIFSGVKRSLDLDTAVRLGRALHVSPEWLGGGDGPDPIPTGPVPDRLVEYGIDPAHEAAVRTVAAGGVDAVLAPRNQLEAAVQTLLLELDPEIIAEARAEFAGKEDDRPAHHWGRLLRDREQARRARLKAKKRPPRRQPTPKRKAS
jgi:hypothetical protein